MIVNKYVLATITFLFGLVFSLSILLSCNRAIEVVEIVIENYPSDNPIEEIIETGVEHYFDLEDGSLDITPFSKEKK